MLQSFCRNSATRGKPRGSRLGVQLARVHQRGQVEQVEGLIGQGEQQGKRYAALGAILQNSAEFEQMSTTAQGMKRVR